MEDLDEAAADLRRRGAEFYSEPRLLRPGLKIAFVRGPDDVRIEILERQEQRHLGSGFYVSRYSAPSMGSSVPSPFSLARW